MKFSILLTLTAAVVLQDCGAQDIIWPQPSKLLGFWPLNNYYKFRDVSGNKNDGKRNGQASPDSNPGPFGDPYQSYTSTTSGIMTVSDPDSTKFQFANSSFTISFFIKHRATTNDGILQFNSKELTLKALSFEAIYKIANKNNFEIFSNRGSKGFQVLTSGVWMFVAVRFMVEKNIVFISGRHGPIYTEVEFPGMLDGLEATNDGFVLGKTSRNSWLNSYASVSCLMMYNTFLSTAEVAEAHDACRIIHSSPPCGSPRIPLPVIPSPDTTVTRHGQFPWLASLKSSNKHICVASILDQFFLLTAASCFDGLNTRKYSVMVGEHDTAVSETFERSHNLRAIFIHPRYDPATLENDVAIFEVRDAIDLSNPYVNDVCLPTYKAPELSGTFYVPGWGQAGRNPFATETSPRYVVGSVEGVNSSCPDVRNIAGEDTTAIPGNGTTFYPWLTMTATNNYLAPDVGDEGAGLLLPTGTDGFGVASRFHHRGIYSHNDANCENYSPRFENTERHLRWIRQTISCFQPNGNTPEDCPRSNTV